METAWKPTVRVMYTRQVWKIMFKTKRVNTLFVRCVFLTFFFTAVAPNEKIPTASNDPSGVFCFNGASYIHVGTSWNTSCVTYRCTLSGIKADNMTHPRCEFLSDGVDMQPGCKSTIVESEDTCCQGIMCPLSSVVFPAGVLSCPAGWTELTQRRGTALEKRQVSPRDDSSDSVQCLKYSQSRKSFFDAAQDCRNQSASLINLDYWYSVFSDKFLALENIKEVGNGFWTGLSSDGMKFYWDDILVPIAQSYRNACSPWTDEPYGWDCWQPEGNSTCVKAKFAKGKIILASTPCEQQLHYACLKDSRDRRSSVSRGNEACPEDWLYSSSTKKCYKFFNDRLSAFRAVSSCQEINATLASASDRDELLAIQSCFSDTTDSVPKEIHGSICLSSAPGECVQPNVSLPIWFMNSTNDRWNCTTIKNLNLRWTPPELNRNNASFSSCYRKLPYICEKPLSNLRATVTEILAIASRSSEGIELTCKAERDLTEDGYCGWRADGVYEDTPRCMRFQPSYEQMAFDCFITDSTSGNRIFSNLIITEKEQTVQEPLRLTAIIKMPSDWLNYCLSPQETRSIRRLAQHLLFLNNVRSNSSLPTSSSISLSDVATTTAGIVKNWSSKITSSEKVTCWVSKSSATLIYALKFTSTNNLRSKRAADNWSNSSETINPNQSLSDDQSDEIEQDLTDYWIRRNGGAVVMDSAVNLTLEHISVKSLYFCKKRNLATKELGVLTIPRTAIGEWFNFSICLSTTRPIVSMYCRPQFTTGAFWETFAQSECPDELSPSEKQLKLLVMNVTMNSSVSFSMAEALKVMETANNASGMTTAMIVDTANLVEKTLSMLADSSFPSSELVQFASNIPAMVDQVMRAPKESVWQAEAVAYSSTTLIKALEMTSEKLLETVSIGNTMRVIFGNVALEVSKDPNFEGIGVLSSESFSAASLAHLRSDSDPVEHLFVAQIATWLREGEKTSKRFTVFRNAKLFKGRVRVPATDIILSANIDGLEENIATSDFIRAKFSNVKGVNSQSVECGFWSIIDHDWSTEGCRKVYSNDMSTLCYCNHTTSFAILMGAKPQELAHYQALSWITLVGLSISSAALLIVLLTFLMFKAMRQSLSQKVLFNLALAMFLLDVTFLAGSQSTKNKWACMVIAVLLHYLLLSSFAWMTIEAIHQYFRFVKVIGTYIPRFIVKAAIPAWGLPAVVVGIILAKDYQLYIRLDNVCWVQEHVIYFGVLLPVALVLVFNFTVFVLILRSLLSQRNSHLRSNQTEMMLMKLHLRAAVALLVIMGLTWIFGFLTFQETGVFGIIFQYLFCIFNSVQGLLVFVFHCVRERNVINIWKTLFGCGQVAPKLDEFSTATTNDNESTMPMLPKRMPADIRL